MAYSYSSDNLPPGIYLINGKKVKKGITLGGITPEVEMLVVSGTDFEMEARSCRSCRPEVFCNNGVLRKFAKFIGKHLRQSLFFNKVADSQPATLLKKRLWHRCFPLRNL